MDILISIGNWIIAAFITISTILAGLIGDFITSTPQQVYTSPTSLASQYESSTAIPDILIKNSAYQQAAVITAQSTQYATTSLTDTVVNIFCTYTTATFVRTTTGSGFIISPTGVIITNAHIAQFLLLDHTDAPGTTHCRIRSGSPATERYEAKLLYISPAWIKQNAHQILSQKPIGTGERDYALLYITKTTNQEPLPANFPYLALATSSITQKNLGETLRLSGYPADALQTNGTQTSLPQQTATTTLTDIFTFSETNADVLSVDHTPLSTGGSSGGVVIDHAGLVVGMIVTRGETAEDSLRALTIEYINRTILEETGATLLENSNGAVDMKAAVFIAVLGPFLQELLLQAL